MTKFDGATTSACGVTASEEIDAMELPRSLVAATVTVYDVEVFNPTIVFSVVVLVIAEFEHEGLQTIV